MATTFNNTVYQAGFAGTDDGAPSASFQIDDASRNPLTVNGTVAQAGDPITVTGILPGATTSSTTTFYATQFDNPSMIQFTDTQSGANGSSTRLVLSNSQVFGSGTGNRTRFTSDGDTSLNSYAAPVCFATGTLIRTSLGDVAVEDLSVGDLAITSSGASRPIRWIGSRTINCERYSQPSDVMPVRIRAGAFGTNKPVRDLVVSPGHSICLDVLGEVLIPASVLVNGSTIVQEDVDSVTYWHVELDSHDLLIAEGQAAESYLEMGNRGFFARSTDDATVTDLAAKPDGDAGTRTHADFCRPFHDSGALVAFARQRIEARAVKQGWQLAGTDAWADVYLVADGVRIKPEVSGLVARFVAPAGSQDIWLHSPTSTPSKLGMGADIRRLGLRLSELRLDDSWDAREVALDDPLLCVGFHAVESDGTTIRRWTADKARLPAALWSDDYRTLVIRLDPVNAALPRWVMSADIAGDALLVEQNRSAA
ncbi:Hint domain-containing protein [Methylobacterium sp. WL120]|uniref:Hint domain-containing protein n=1 Tax=Methylobacterium sp. WL120 TaxID=2603887 RepID=UPI0011CCBD81|nr:Hint domain-containing protein [Methylobacterium sp. WL120]TXM64598.1 Hint domain-containing protein [Methylobacterium sp. WL120]